MRQERDLTKGAIVKSLWLFALPLMLGNVLKQLYNLVDTWVVGRYLGKRALAAVGGLSIVLTILLYGFVRPLTYLLQVPAETVEDMVTYLIYVFAGFFAIFLYNYFASILRSIGNSVLPWQPLSPST